jgi:hypothetical protein
MDWIYKGKVAKTPEDLDPNTIGFIYKITNSTNGRIYIGKKYIIKGKKWQTYYGSNKDLHQDIVDHGVNKFQREILKCCFDNINLTYWEVHYQCLYSVLTENSYNGQILGKFWKGKVTK